MSDQACVLVIGATGLFGELLVRRLIGSQRFKVIGVARNHSRLQVLQADTNVSTAVIDTNNEEDVASHLSRFKPFAVIDCAGPFQYYGDDPYRFARQVLNAGANYIDIADAPAFVSGIGELDSLAKEKSLLAISGASSCPAISAAVTDELVESLQNVLSIEIAIVPGNRTRRTLSVMKAILGQVGQPFDLFRYGSWETAYGWSETRKITLSLQGKVPVKNRLASLVNTPEHVIFPERYNADSVAVFAGLEIKTFHRLLRLCGRLVRMGLLASLVPLVKPARFIASRFRWLGSDVGGMQVYVVGADTNNKIQKRTWNLVAGDGAGPNIPTLPVSVILDKLYRGSIETGARPACGEVELNELETYFKAIGAETAVKEQEHVSVFKTVLRDSFNRLPAAVQSFHNTVGKSVYQGSAESLGPTGITGRLAAFITGFPGAANDIPVEVTITANTNSEVWVRNFNGRYFQSELAVSEDGCATERFGPLTMSLGLHVSHGCLFYPVIGAKLFGLIPIPRMLLPESIAHESVDSQGRYTFDVCILTPFGARIAHYKGWLS